MRLLVLAAVATGFAYQYFPKSMDGSVWDVKVRRDVLLSWSRRDTLVFDGGRLAVTGPVAASVVPARYATHGEGAGMQWTATTEGSGGATFSWQGAVNGARMNGTVLSTDASGRVSRLKFSGARNGAGR